MIDLSYAQWHINRYGGSDKKRTLFYDGRYYMVKFPEEPRSKKVEISYINSQFAEHVGCQIFKLAGMEAQNTFLGRYVDSSTGKEKIVVACEDFTQDGNRLLEFSKIGLHEMNSDKKYATNFEDVHELIERIRIPMDKTVLTKYFWDMFVVDALIGNIDRHLDNWGLLEQPDGRMIPAPIYDCGSALSPLKSDEEKQALLENPNLMKSREYNLCTVYRKFGTRVAYHEIFKDPPHDLEEAILRMVPRIQTAMPKMEAVIDATEGMTAISKAYMKKSVDMRLEKILSPALKKVQGRQYERVR